MKLIHIADIHLGVRPDKGYPWSETRGEEIWQSFRKLLQQVEEEQVDLLLIAGDLFHSQPLSKDLKEVSYLFEKLTVTHVVLMMGNHDYLKLDSGVLTFEWPENVSCLFKDTVERIYFPDIDTYVYGCSYHARMIGEPIYDGVEPGEEQGCHILLAHGGDTQHVPMNLARISGSRFDYVALGHIHKPQIIRTNKMAYSGALEPIDCNDTGVHGYIRGEYHDGRMQISFEPFAKREYISLQVESTPVMTDLEMEEKIIEEIQYRGKEHIYRIVLTGYRDPDITYHCSRYESLGNILEIRDQTEPDLDIMELYRQHRDDILGRFIGRLYKPEERIGEVQKKALYHGIRALLEEK